MIKAEYAHTVKGEIHISHPEFASSRDRPATGGDNRFGLTNGLFTPHHRAAGLQANETPKYVIIGFDSCLETEIIMTQRTEHGTGLAAALSAFGIWGFLPLYFHLIGPRVSVWEVLSHRIVWATV
ncbi:MAG: hypothetical protein P8090_19390, partial [Gammaproteobacteria bacterium]